MEELLIAACSLLFAAGYIVRDGWPATGYTNRGARPLGALLCGLGTFAVLLDWKLALYWTAAVLLSFYTDQKHAAGQNAKTPMDFVWLTVSGVTSILPQILLGVVLFSNDFIALLAVGLLKPIIWDICWSSIPETVGSWVQPTRIAALSFGALIGLVIGMGF